MTSWQRWLLWVSSVVAGATGLAYAVLRYLVRPSDPFSAYNHPLQPWALAAHVVLAPALLFAVGWFWGNHVLPKLGRRVPGRISGLSLLALVVLMAGSGYVLQVSSEPSLRLTLAWIHGLAGAAYLAWLAGHALRAGREETGTLSFSSSRIPRSG
jgi:threonine/homoserine/homoserine lactone efflux protein